MAKKQTNTSVTVTYKGIIYCYTSKTSGLRYIGQTVNERKRRQRFLSNSIYCTSSKQGGKLSHFDLARFKYGVQDFDYEILESVESNTLEDLHNKLNILERKYIEKFDTFNNGYNSTNGGHEGWLMTSEVRKIMSNLAKERFKNIENHPMFGKHHTEETKRKISEAKKNKHTGREHHNSKSILCFTKNGVFVQEFDSMASAVKFVDNPRANHSAISGCCNGTRKSAYGYIWKFKNK